VNLALSIKLRRSTSAAFFVIVAWFAFPPGVDPLKHQAMCVFGNSFPADLRKI
jgi:hypothetical protein